MLNQKPIAIGIASLAILAVSIPSGAVTVSFNAATINSIGKTDNEDVEVMRRGESRRDRRVRRESNRARRDLRRTWRRNHRHRNINHRTWGNWWRNNWPRHRRSYIFLPPYPRRLDNYYYAPPFNGDSTPSPYYMEVEVGAANFRSIAGMSPDSIVCGQFYRGEVLPIVSLVRNDGRTWAMVSVNDDVRRAINNSQCEDLNYVFVAYSLLN